ncbi:MAG: hypothetical protein IJB79_03505 [Candidatus Gastranaerophilales bacterium]|nr:hypothetical protein [Candidatus Gastranaerophilales bacterium]
MQEELNNTLKLSDKTTQNFFGKPDKYDYSKFSSSDEFDWDEELMNKLTPLAQKLNLSQESLEMLLELALEMSRKQKAQYEKDEETKHHENVLNYNKMFSEDLELSKCNSSQIREFMSLANSAYSEFTSPKLKETLEKTGLVYHPEMIKMFHKIGVLAQEDNLSHCGAPAFEELTPAQILYGTNK